MSSLLSDFLDALEVPHTRTYSDRAFATMPFKSLFGFSRQLKAFGIDSVAVEWTDKSILPNVPTPFLAQVGGSFVIVERIEIDSVTFRNSHAASESLPLSSFRDRWSGIALLAYPTAQSREPDLNTHRLTELASIAKRAVLIVCAAILLVDGIINASIFRGAGPVALLLVDLAGLAVTWLLILKSLKVASHSADRICGILQDHGCDTVLEQKASSFFGIVSWSEVGLSYFGVSTAILLIFPQCIGWLALVNLLCLPFTFWSIWYQRFRLHTWCTLCVTTQALLWLQAGSYLWAGAWHHQLSSGWSLAVIAAAYGAALLALNRLTTFIKHHRGAES